MKRRSPSVFYLYDDKAFSALYKDRFIVPFRDMFSIVNGAQMVSVNKLCRINQVFIIVPGMYEAGKIHQKIIEMMESVPLIYSVPEVAKLEDE